MAKEDDPLHDNPRSPKAKGKQVAEKGDVKTRQQVDAPGDPDEELESAGYLYGKRGERASDKDVEDREHLSLSPPGDAEVWKRRKKKEVPTS